MDSSQDADNMLLSQETFDHLLQDIGNCSSTVRLDDVNLQFVDEAPLPRDSIKINYDVMEVHSKQDDGPLPTHCEPIYECNRNFSQQDRYMLQVDNSDFPEQQYGTHTYFGNELCENRDPSCIMPTAANSTAGDCMNTESIQCRPLVSPSPPLAVPGRSYGSPIPSNTDYPGLLNFTVTFPPASIAKSATWTYSSKLKKLYCQMSKICPAEIRTSALPPQGTFIRIMAIFKKSEHIAEVVRRCPTHQQSSEFNHGSTAPLTHLVRVECNRNVRYEEHPITGRQSVVMLFEVPQVGTDLTKVLFRFMCNTSCPGSMNRRPIYTVITIETPDGEVLGRFCCETRVCASPGRDRKMDEQRMHQTDEEQQPVNVQEAASPTTQKPAQAVQQMVTHEEAETQTSQSLVLSAQPQPVEQTPQVPGTSCSSNLPENGEPAACTSSQGCKLVHELVMTAGSRGGSQRSSDQEQTYYLMVKGKEDYTILKKIKESLELIRMLPQQTIDTLRSMRKKQRIAVELRGNQPGLSRHGSECSQQVLSCSQGSDRTCIASSSAQNGPKANVNGANGPPQLPVSDSTSALPETLLDSKPNNSIYNFLKQMDCLECMENFTSRALLTVQQMRNFTLQDLAELGVPEAKTQLLLHGIQEYHASTAIFSQTKLKRSPSEETISLTPEDDDCGIDTKDGARAPVVPALQTFGSDLSSASQRSHRGSGGEYIMRLRACQTIYLPCTGNWGGSGSQERSSGKRRRGDRHSDSDQEEGQA